MRKRDYAVALAVPLIFAAVLAHPLFDRLQGLSLDTLFFLRNRLVPAQAVPDGLPVAVIAIDEATYGSGVEPFATTPRVFWTRAIAEVLEGVLAGGAEVIGFDLILPTSVEQIAREPHFERPFRQFLGRSARAGKVVLGATTLGERPILPHKSYRQAVRGRNIRSLNVVPDRDGVVRSVPLMFRAAGSEDDGAAGLVPSMSLELAARLLDVRPGIDAADGSLWLGDYRIPALTDPGLTVPHEGGRVALDNEVLVDLYGGPATIPTYSFIDLYRCLEAGDEAYFRRHFAGRAVMFGLTLDVEDRKLTSVRYGQLPADSRPLEPCVPGAAGGSAAWPQRDLIPGVYVHAAAIANLVDHRVLRPLDRGAWIGLSALVALLVAFLTMRFGSAAAGIGFAAVSLGWVGAGFGAFLGGWVLPLFHPIAASALTLAALLGYRFAVIDRTERHIRRAFGTILAPALVERMVETGQVPTQGGELREITVWISDLQNYTTISEVLEPPELVAFLNRVYSVMSDTIEEHGGFVAQFVGDAVVAGFNVPLEDPDHARHGIEAALACCRRVSELSEGLDLPGGFEVRIRVGVSTGALLAGYIGSTRRLSYSIVGDDINLASRLEGVNKLYGCQILVNEVTKELCGPAIAFREIDIVRVKGREQPVRIFEPLGRAETLSPAKQTLAEDFARALEAFRARRFEEAAEAFEALAAGDPVSEAYAARARAFAAEPPPADWDGVNVLLSK